MGEAPHGLQPWPLGGADKRRDPEEVVWGQRGGPFTRGPRHPLLMSPDKVFDSVVKVVKKFPVALLGSGAPLNCLMKYAGSLDPAARCGKPYIWPQMRGCGGEGSAKCVQGGLSGVHPYLAIDISFSRDPL